MTAAWRSTAALAAALMVGVTAVGPGAAQDLQVVATIRPLHAIVAAVMQSAGSPRLLVEGAASPHTFVLKPSDARAVAKAAVLFRIGPTLEPFTIKLAASLPKSVAVVSLIETPGLTLHRLRTGGTFEAHAHAPARKGHAHGHDHDDDHDQAKAGNDGHIWLDPANARVLARRIAAVLGDKDGANAARYQANAEAFGRSLDALEREIAASLVPVAGRPYIVFHDAYQYFERRFGLQPAGSVTVSPDVPPSARRISALRRKIAQLKAVCIFAEPQFAPKVIAPIVEGSAVRRGTLDPLGAALPAGPGQYEALLRGLAGDLRACLNPPS